MNAATHARSRLAHDPDRPGGRLNWTAVGIAVTLAMAAGNALWTGAILTARVARLEQEIPPGVIARLDERTLAIQKSVERMEARR